MTTEVERQLMRLLHGEVTDEEAVRLRSRLEGEPELAAWYAEMESLWGDLDLPQPAPADPSLSVKVRERLHGDAAQSVVEMWRLAPVWSRALAAAALAIGIGLGTFLGSGTAAVAEEAFFDQAEPSLAESYWLVLEEDDVEMQNEATR